MKENFKMLPYGVPLKENPQLVNWWPPDCLDIQTYGFASRFNQLPNKNGETHNSFRSSARKRNVRRIWKKIERTNQRRELRRLLQEEGN